MCASFKLHCNTRLSWGLHYFILWFPPRPLLGFVGKVYSPHINPDVARKVGIFPWILFLHGAWSKILDFWRNYWGLCPNLEGLLSSWVGFEFSGRCLMFFEVIGFLSPPTPVPFRLVGNSNSTHLPGLVLRFRDDNQGCYLWPAVHQWLNLEVLSCLVISFYLTYFYHLFYPSSNYVEGGGWY